MTEFRRLIEKLTAHWATRDRRRDLLLPGRYLQPSFLDLPSAPESDVLWPSPGSLLISTRLRDLLKPMLDSGIRTCPVILRRMGRRRPCGPFRVPKSGEPEDLIRSGGHKVRTHRKPPTYSEVVFLDEWLDPPGVISCPRCRQCGERVYRDLEGQHWNEVYQSEKRAWAHLDRRALARWMGDRHLVLVNGAIVGSAAIRKALQNADASNIRFEPFPSPEPDPTPAMLPCPNKEL
jgi:hypothetical protein